LQHIFKGLKAAEVVRAVDDAVNEAKTLTGIEAGIILCTLRHYSEAQSLQTVHLFKEFKDSNVVGFDLAADEAGFPITSHIKTFQFANENGINCTAHAGEAKGAESVWETLQMLRPKRIGHGVRSIEDVELLTYLKENKIHLEICPTSNIQTNVFDRMENHSIDQIYKSGISMSINTDARTISNVSLTDEYETLARVFNWTKKHFLNCNLQAIDHSFLSIEKKEKLKTVLVNGYS
jgi:adenosine deaminase